MRAPFFFLAVIDWDESTFILIGQSMVDGHLPYAHLWDVKPPLLFTFFAATLALFGHSLIGVRLAGALCVAASGWLVYLLARRWGDRTAAGAAAVLSVLAGSLIASGQATMSEHVMLPALLGALHVWLRAPGTLRAAAGAGVLMAVATLVRSNVIVCALAFAPVVWLGAMRGGSRPTRAVLAYGAGGLAVLTLASLPFAMAGRLTLLWQSAVVAAGARAQTPGSLGAHLAAMGGMMLDGWLPVLLWALALGGLALLWRRRVRGQTDAPAAPLVVVAAALLASITLSGDLYHHYFIQLVPLAAVFSAVLFRHAAGQGRRTQAVVLGLVVACTVASMRPVAGEAWRLAQRLANGEPVIYGPAVSVARYIELHGGGRPVLLMIDHLAYWLLQTDPPAGLLTHPAVIERDDVLRVMGTTARAQLDQVFALEPGLVVFDPRLWFLDGDAGRYLKANLAERYVLVAEIQGRQIHRLRDW